MTDSQWANIFLLFLLVVYVPEKGFFVVFDVSGQFQFKLRFCFSNCISAHPGNVLVVLNEYLYAFPFLVCFSFGFEQTQNLAVKPEESLAPPTALTFKGDELVLCFQESVLGKLPALTSSFILHKSFPWNPSQLWVNWSLERNFFSFILLKTDGEI